VVNEFFDECFFVTDQFSATQAIEWTLDEDKEEHWVDVPTSFLTQGYLRSLVSHNEEEEEENEAEDERDSFFRADSEISEVEVITKGK